MDNKKSYTKNYLKIYLWKGVSIVLNFLSMFIVLPLLSADKISYGVYAICTSFSVFFSYSDLGFIAAGQKYAAESYARNNQEEERTFTGFVIFIFSVFVFLFSAFLVFVCLYPTGFISNLTNSKQVNIASNLFLILAAFAPTYILQRLNQIVYSVRIEDFIPHRTYIFASALKIISVFFFFNGTNGDIVGYFLTIQIISFLAELCNLLILRLKYSYPLLDLFAQLKFNKSIFNQTKRFALNSLFLTVSWVIFYEMDTVIVGKLLGADQAAIFAIALTLATFFRTLLSTFYAPYSVRFYHFVGNKDVQGLKRLLLKVIHLTTPFVFIAVATSVILSNQVIVSWVGLKYADAIVLAQLLLLMHLFASISYPASMALMALEKLKPLYVIYVLMPIIYWGGVLMTYKFYGLGAFGFFKTFAFFITVFYNFYVICKIMEIDLKQELYKLFRLLILPIATILISAFLLQNIELKPFRSNLLFITIEGIIIFTLSFISGFLINRRVYLNMASIARELLFKKSKIGIR